VPERFQQMITRAAEYGNDRIILGAHYAMDIIAGRTIAYYDIAQMLANNPTYVGQTEGGVTISNYQTALTSATNDLTSALQTGCGNTIAVCATQDTSRFSSAAANAAFYQSTQTYGLPVVYANETGVQNVNTLAPDAGYLLETRFPYLTLSQRNDVLTSTEGPGGGFLDNGSSFGVYSILDLYTAANGYGSFASTVAITMNASLGGFNAFDTWSNNIAGTGGFTFSAGSTGTLEFSGANTYSGPTTISGGTLVITGSIVSPTTVNPGGTLAGTGTIGALTVSGGTLAPGLPAIASTTGAATIGQLTATGAVSFSSGSVYQVKISPAGASDNLTTSGTATLGGTVQAIPAAGTYKFNQSYAILNAASVSGTFQGLTGLSGLGTAYLPELTYTLNAVDLVLAPNTISSQLPSGSSGNVLAIAGGIDKSLLTGNAPAAFTNLFNVAPSQLPATIKSLSPEAAIAAQTSALQAGGLFLSTMLNPYVMNGGRGTPVSAAATGPALAGASRQYTLAAADMPGWTVWATASGGDTRTDGSASAGTSAVTSQLYGVIAGADYVLSPQARVGFALSAGGTDAGVSDGLGTSAGSFGQIGIDGTYDFGSAYVAAAAGFGYLGFDTTRTIYIGGYDRLKSSSDGTLFGGRAEAGYRMPVGPALLVPYAAVTPQGFSANSATEYGTLAATNFGLIYHGRTTDSVPTELGARGSMAISLAGLNVTAFGRLAWEHEFDRTRTIDASFISSPVGSFSASGAPPAANAALATIGAQVGLENGLILAVAADGSFSGSVNGAGGQVSLRYSW
jgi:autotransporter-associated beta strand protein